VLGVREKSPNGGIHDLWSTVRDLSVPQGSWSTMSPVAPEFLPDGYWDISDVDEISIPKGSVYGCDETHSIIAINYGPIPAPGVPSSFVYGELLYKRQRTDGTWNLFTTLSGGIGASFTPSRPYRFRRVAVARVGANLHVCGVTVTPPSGTAVDPGKLLHGVRVDNPGGAPELRMWTGWDDVRTLTSSMLPTVADVGCAGVTNLTTGGEQLHVCVVTDDGHLLHSIQDSPTSWEAFGDVAAQAGNMGPFTRVACAANNGQLYVVAVTTSGRALFTIRGATAWRPFEDVVNAASFPFSNLDQVYDVGIGFCNDGLPAGQTQLNILASAASGLHYTILSNQPIAWPGSPGGPSPWKPWANLETETAYTDGGRFSAVCVGSLPRP
jgi:hypothetical protein